MSTTITYLPLLGTSALSYCLFTDIILSDPNRVLVYFFICRYDLYDVVAWKEVRDLNAA